MALNENLTVCKFGGTSLATAEQCLKVKKIVESDKRRRVIVVSAPGMRHEDDVGVTDLLRHAYRSRAVGQRTDPVLADIRNRFEQISTGCELDEKTGILDVGMTLSKLGVDGGTEEFFTSRGEFMMAVLMADLLDATFLDADDAIRFDERGQVDFRATCSCLREAILGSDNKRFVIPGYYGVMPDATIRTFPRGGSDITADIVAGALKAGRHENWTDVDGVFRADPRVVRDARVIPELTYQELRELSLRGAKVVHPDAMRYARSEGFPIEVGNTNTGRIGTRVSSFVDEHDRPGIIGISGEKGIHLIRFGIFGMDDQVGEGLRILGLFARKGVPFGQCTTSIDNIAITVRIPGEKETQPSQREVLTALDDIYEELSDSLDAENLEHVKGLALISVVGRDVEAQTAELLAALDREKVVRELTNGGATSNTLIIGVHEDELEKAIRALSRVAFSSGQPTPCR